MQMTKKFPSFFKYSRTEVFVLERKELKLNSCTAFFTATQNLYVQFFTTAVSHNLHSSSKVQSICRPNFYTTRRNLHIRKQILKSKTTPSHTQLFLASTARNILTFPRKVNSQGAWPLVPLRPCTTKLLDKEQVLGPITCTHTDHENSFSLGHLATQLCVCHLFLEHKCLPLNEQPITARSRGKKKKKNQKRQK